MAATRQCPVCGAEIPPDAPSGMCVACLLSSGRQGGSTDPKSPDPGATIRISNVSEECVGNTIGRYKLLEKIGEGGFGVVWAAEQREPVRRRVALKIIKLGMDTKQVVARFEAERQALAMMDHPNIAKVLDAGVTESGRPYFVMELVHGIKITDYCDRNKLATRERLLLFTKVCRAVQHAHQKGIIHRDLKPGNILVTLYDGVPEPKVIDFGIAKATQGSLTDKTVYTGFQQIIGSPPYMSPEQAEMSALDIDTRTDIYSLGVLLYEMLSGKTPFDQKELLDAGLEAMLRIIREREPLRPSTRLNTLQAGEQTTVAKCRGTEAPKLIHLLRGDLDWIVMKSLEKDRTRRYETANGLAMDIERHLANEPVTACPPSAAYRLQKLVRRNKAAVATTAAVFASLIVGLAIALHQYAKEKEEHLRALRAQANEAAASKRAGEMARRESGLRADAEAARETEKRALGLMRIRAAEDYFADNFPLAMSYLARVLRDDPSNNVAAERLLSALTYRRFAMPHGKALSHQQRVNYARFSPDGKLIVSASDDGTAQIWDADSGARVSPPLQHSDAVTWAEFSPNGRFVVTASQDGTAKLWNLAVPETPTTIFPHSNRVNTAHFSYDGKLVITASDDGTAIVWDAATRGLVAGPFRHNDHVLDAKISPDGHYLLTIASNNPAHLWNLATKEVRAFNFDWTPVSIDFSPDSRRFVTATWDHNAWLWETDSGSLVNKLRDDSNGHHAALRTIEFSGDGRRLLTASMDGGAVVWDGNTGAFISRISRTGNPLTGAKFSPDGRLFVTSSVGGAVRIWNTASGFPETELLAHQYSVRYAEFDYSGSRILSVSGNEVRVWDVSASSTVALLLTNGSIGKARGMTDAVFDRSGVRVATASEDGVARVWDSRTGDVTQVLEGSATGLTCVRFSPEGRKIAAGTQDGIALVWDILSGKVMRFASNSVGNCRSVEFSPDNRYLLMPNVGHGFATIWEIGTTNLVSPKRFPLGDSAMATFNRDGRQFVAANDEGFTYVFDAATGEPASGRISHDECICWTSFAPDGKSIATASWDGTARIWDAVTGLSRTIPMRHDGPLLHEAFSPDGLELVTASKDWTARVWDAHSGLALTDPLRHKGPVVRAKFSPDGRWIATASFDHTARVWDKETGLAISEAFTHDDRVNTVEFSPNGKHLLTASSDGTARIWPLLSVNEVAPLWLMELAEALGGQRMNDEGKLETVPIDKVLEIRATQNNSRDTDVFSRWARWFFADPSTRPASPLDSRDDPAAR